MSKKKKTKKTKAKKTKAKKTKAKLQRHYIHDNGGRPFMVEVRGRDVVVFEKTGSSHHERPSNYKKQILAFEDVDVFVPSYSEKHGKTTWNADGNTILLVEEVPEDDWTFYHCVWIGQEIYRFVTNEPVTAFHSPVGNSDVPYPYAVSENKVYLVLEKIELSRALFPKVKDWATADPYGWYYSHVGRLDGTYAYEVLRARR